MEGKGCNLIGEVVDGGKWKKVEGKESNLIGGK